jgi:hypothetical protein
MGPIAKVTRAISRKPESMAVTWLPKHYLPDAPRKHRDVEPFPLSSVQALVRRRIDQLLGEITAQQALIVRLSTLKDMRP